MLNIVKLNPVHPVNPVKESNLSVYLHSSIALTKKPVYALDKNPVNLVNPVKKIK